MSANLASLLFGAYRRGVLALLLLRPEDSLHLREIARAIHKAPGTLVRELNALAEAGVLVRKRVGNQVHFQANPGCPIFEDLRNILKKTVGVADVLREALAPLAAEIRAAFIYGSVAKGGDTAASDIDLMVISEKLHYADVFGTLEPVLARLGRPVNPTVYTPKEMARRIKEGNAFVNRVLAQSKVMLIGRENDLAA